MIKIWYRPKGGEAECIDSFPAREVGAMFWEYYLAYNIRHSGDKLWMGLKREEPKD